MKIDLYKSRYFEPTTSGGQSAVAERDGDDIAREAYAEQDGTEPKKKEPADDAVEPPVEEPAKVEAEPQPEGEPVKEEEEAPVEEAPAEGEKPAEEPPAAVIISDEVIQAHAVKQGVTYAQAKEDLEASQAILDKYKDPLELARAHRAQQREYDRLKSEGQQPKDTAPVLLTDAELKAEVGAYAKQNAEKIVAKYRTENPKRTEMMEDEAVLEWAVQDAMNNYRVNAAGEINRIKTQAGSRRTELLASIPKEDAKFVHDVTLLLNATSDRALLSPKYDIKPLLWHAKGQRFDSEVKAAYERGLKVGKEQPKILGTAGVGGAAKGGDAPRKVVGKTTLTPRQQAAALDQFPDSDPAKAELLWADVYKEDLKKNPNYLPV